MKIKRTVLTILITAAALAASNRYWLKISGGGEFQSSLRFDFDIFVIILVLTFLAAYKLMDYTADFKAVHGKSRIDIVFLAVFFTFLFIPAAKIDNSEVSAKENRTLAKWQPLINQKGINFSFGKNFNDWFSDRFNFRNSFINIYDMKLMLSKNWITKDVIKGMGNWLFLGWHEAGECYTNKVSFTEIELAVIDNYLKEIADYCKEHNKKFYLLIPPDKSQIYGEYYNPKFKKLNRKPRVNALIDYINAHSKVNVIYPKDYLILNKSNNLLYYKHDTHWNTLGAYFGYTALINRIINDTGNHLPLFKITEYLKAGYAGDLYTMSPEKLVKKDDTIYSLPAVKDKELCSYPVNADYYAECSGGGSDLKLLLFGDSFSQALVPYLKDSFGEIKFIKNYNVSPEKSPAADIIILEVIERNLPQLIYTKMDKNGD